MRFEVMHWSPLVKTWILPVVMNAISLRLDKNHNMPCCSPGRRAQCWEVCALLGGTSTARTFSADLSKLHAEVSLDK